MTAIQNPCIRNIVSRNIEDDYDLINKTQESKSDIFNNLWIKINDSWVFSNIKEYITNLFNSNK
jgi:hypothetical protein